MLNIPLFKRTVRTNGRRWLCCTGFLVLLMLLAVGLYHPEKGGLFRWIPGTLAQALGIDGNASGLTEYLASCLFGFFYPAAALLYGGVTAERLMAEKVETGTMVYLLSAPNKRKTVAATQAYFLVMSLFAMFFFTGVAGGIIIALLCPGKLDITQYILLHIGGFCLELALAGIGFLASCAVNEGSRALALGLGVPGIFLVLSMLANMGGILGILKYTTIFTLFQGADVLTGSLQICWKFPALAAVGFACIALGTRLFRVRDLPL